MDGPSLRASPASLCARLTSRLPSGTTVADRFGILRQLRSHAISTVTDNLPLVTDHNGIIRYLATDNCARANEAAFADTRTSHHDRAGTDEAVITARHRLTTTQWLVRVPPIGFPMVCGAQWLVRIRT